MRSIIIRQFRFLSRYLEPEFARDPNLVNSRSREKLQRLSHSQFNELLTDVSDELHRRINNDPNIPHLPSVDTFHPKRNHARQKMSTLAPLRLRDLCIDVFFELQTRYPAVVAESPSNVSSSSLPNSSGAPRTPTNATASNASTASLGKASSPQYMPATTAINTNQPPRLPTPSSSSPSVSNMPHRLPKAPHGREDVSIESSYMTSPTASPSQQQAIPVRSESPTKFLSRIELLESNLAKANSLLDANKAEMEAMTRQHTADQAKHKNELFQLEDKLHEAVHEKTTLSSQLEAAQKKIEELTKEVEKVNAAAEERQTKRGNMELEEHLSQMRMLIQAESKHLNELDEMQSQLERVKRESFQWKEKYYQVKLQNESASKVDATACLFQNPPVSPETLDKCTSDDGVFNRKDFVRYLFEMNEFIAATRSENSSQLLTKMKSLAIVLDTLATQAREKSFADSSELMKHMDEVYIHADTLMLQVRNFAINKGLTPLLHIDATAYTLSSVLINIVKQHQLHPDEMTRSSRGDGTRAVNQVETLSHVKEIVSKETDNLVAGVQALVDSVHEHRSQADVYEGVRNIAAIVRDVLFDITPLVNQVSAFVDASTVHDTLKALRDNRLRLLDAQDFDKEQSNTQLPDIAIATVAAYKQLLRLIDDAEFQAQFGKPSS
ncbi:GTPase activating protein [Schizosaccharomyces japonicus yFS275]|uniref:GTPase activating protein n=1 Tax=Schizosaccharomyces japonicus (strain yFS275 / FY16936) TaxID=402676 RepID=B6K4R3_SCHJY|nr:GTPase activating protein [Schizosaccharomyces japonicus yFS275]EEB08470.1 GTPase activating protein [Schizosaccharomyces japonicus yFS275]